VVVAPTVAAVGLAFFAYGFPMVGTCVEIGIPQVLVIVFFALVSAFSATLPYIVCNLTVIGFPPHKWILVMSLLFM
jgi:hypothetical protein